MQLISWAILITIIVLVLGYIFTEEGQGVPRFIDELTLNARTLWNIGIITIAATLIVKYLTGN